MKKPKLVRSSRLDQSANKCVIYTSCGKIEVRGKDTHIEILVRPHKTQEIRQSFNPPEDYKAKYVLGRLSNWKAGPKTIIDNGKLVPAKKTEYIVDMKDWPPQIAEEPLDVSE